MFKVGQKVWCVMFGEGVVTKISSDDAKYPLVVEFRGTTTEHYTLDGKYMVYATQTLFPYLVEIVKKVMKPSINWEHVGSKFNYLAEDSEGGAYLFVEEPYVATDASAWYAQSDEVVEAHGFASYTPGTCDWRASLISRPGSD